MSSSHLALVEHELPPQSNEQPPRKYHYDEFCVPGGEEYLNILLQQILPSALWRTWHWAVSFQAPGRPLYVGVSKLAERVRPGERKVYLDLQELEGRGLLKTIATRMPIVQKDGTVTTCVVTVKDFGCLYDLAHEYHVWLHSPDYLPPRRECLPLIEAIPELVKKVLRFDNYRRLLLCQKPGRKPQSKEAHGWYASDQEQGSLETHLSPQKSGLEEAPKVNLYLNARGNEDSPKRIYNEPSINNSSTKESFDSELSFERRGDGVSEIVACRLERTCSPNDYTKSNHTEQKITSSPNDMHHFPTPNPTNPVRAIPNCQDGAKYPLKRERAELDPAVQMAQQVMAATQGGENRSGGATQRIQCYSGDGKPQPLPNDMVSSFLREFGAVLGDKNPRGSITGTLRTIQAAGLTKDLDILLCLVRAYGVARDTREVRPQHRHPDGDNKMPVFVKMVRTFAEAWATGTFQYTEDDLVAAIAADERVRLWVMERSHQEMPSTPSPVEAQTEGVREGTTAPDSDQDDQQIHETEMCDASQEQEHSAVSSSRRRRTRADRQAREDYARRMKSRLVLGGVPQPTVQPEHPACGCPVYYAPTRWGKMVCASCDGDPSWDQATRDLIESIRMYVPEMLDEIQAT